MDPAIAQAIANISAAVVVLILAATAYYFPRGRTRFDKPRDKTDDEEEEDDK